MTTRWPTVLVLASGRGERFRASGGTVHKLQAELQGKPVLQHTLDAVRASGLPWHLEDRGHPGMGDSTFRVSSDSDLSIFFLDFNSPMTDQNDANGTFLPGTTADDMPFGWGTF